MKKGEFLVTTDFKNTDERKARLWDGKKPFSIGTPARWVIEPHDKQWRLLDRETGKPEKTITLEMIRDRKPIRLPGAEDVLLVITQLQRFSTASATQDAAVHTPVIGMNLGVQESPLTKALGASLIALAVIMIGLYVIPMIGPKPTPEEELIPASFSKIILKSTAPPAASAAGSHSTAAPKSAQQTAVAKAFRTQALQNAVKGLLKGGMTRLLQSKSLNTPGLATADALNKSTASISEGSISLDKLGRAQGDVKVASLGGEASAHGAGYRTGDKAAVANQGKIQLKLNTSEATIDEGLTKDEVGEVIHRHASEIRYCYESAMIRTPDLEGKITVGFVIGGNGGVKTADIRSSSVSDAKLEDCVIRRLVSWKFPHPKGGVDVPITYPFAFVSLGR